MHCKLSVVSMKSLNHFIRNEKMFLIIYVHYLLQDTYFSKENEKCIPKEWGYDCIFNVYNRQSRGVALLIKSNTEYKIHNVFKYNDGNFTNYRHVAV